MFEPFLDISFTMLFPPTNVLHAGKHLQLSIFILFGDKKSTRLVCLLPIEVRLTLHRPKRCHDGLPESSFICFIHAFQPCISCLVHSFPRTTISNICESRKIPLLRLSGVVGRPESEREGGISCLHSSSLTARFVC